MWLERYIAPLLLFLDRSQQTTFGLTKYVLERMTDKSERLKTNGILHSYNLHIEKLIHQIFHKKTKNSYKKSTNRLFSALASLNVLKRKNLIV